MNSYRNKLEEKGFFVKENFLSIEELKDLIISIGTDAGKEIKYFALLDYLNKKNIYTDLCILAHPQRKNRSFSLNAM